MSNYPTAVVSKALFVQVSVRVPETLRRRAKMLAARHNITVSQMLVQGLKNVLDQLDAHPSQASLAALKADDPLEEAPEFVDDTDHDVE